MRSENLPFRLVAPLLLAALLASAAAAQDVPAGEAGGATPPATGGQAEVPGPFADSTVKFDFASGLLRRGLYAEAETEYSGFLAKYPGDPRAGEALLWRGEARYRQDKYQDAARDLHDFITGSPGHAKTDFARLRYGCCLFELREYDKAVATLQPLSARKTEDPGVAQSACFYLGLSCHAQKQYPQALAAFAQIDAGPLAQDAIFARAETLAATGAHLEAAEQFGKFVAANPGHARLPEALHRQAEELRIAGKLDEAAARFKDLISRSENDPSRLLPAKYGLGWVRYSQGDDAAAMALARQILESRHEGMADEANYLLGLSALRAKDYATADAALTKVAQGKYAADAAVKRAWALLSAGGTEGALQAAAECARKYPDASKGELSYLSAKAHEKLGQWQQSAAELLTAREAKGDYAQEAAFDLGCAYGGLAAELAKAGDAKAAADAYAKAADAYGYFLENFPGSPRLAEALSGQGGMLMSAGSYAAAIPVLAKLTENRETAPELREAALARQAAAYFQLKQYDNMGKCYRRLTEEFPKGKSAAEALYWLAWQESTEKRFDRAAALYERIVREFPDSEIAPKAWYYRFSSLYRAGEEGQAADVLYEIISRQPQAPVNQQEIVWLGQYLMTHEQLDRAYEVYDNLLRGSPGRQVRAVALYYQAEVKRQRGAWKEACEKYATLLAEKDTGLEPAGLYGLAVCKRNLGDVAGARQTLERVRLAPSDPLLANYYLELGLLDFAEKKWISAASHLMRVGLLYDNEKVCGEALLKASEACLAAGDREKALVCLKELAGAAPDTYGKRYPESEFTKQGLAKLRQLLSAAERKRPEME